MQFAKNFIKFDTNNDIYLALYQICLTPISPGLPGPAALLFYRLLGGLMSKLSRLPIPFDHNDDHYDALIKWQQNDYMNKDTQKSSLSLHTESAVIVQRADASPWIHNKWKYIDQKTTMADSTRSG